MSPERIRIGLPIYAGVARELGSIGVPGYFLGDFFTPFISKSPPLLDLTHESEKLLRCYYDVEER